MVYIQRHIPSANRIYQMNIDNMTGGLNNRSQQMEDNEALNLLNMSFEDDSLMRKRDGTKYFLQNTSEEPEKVVFLDEYKPYEATPLLVQATESAIYLDGVYLSGVEGQISGVNYRGMYMYCDGTGLYSYGHYHQTEDVYNKITGTPIDDYVLVEVKNPGVPGVDYTPLGTEHKRGILRINYTTYTIQYEPCELEVADTYRGANTVPEGATQILVHQDMIFVAGMDIENTEIYMSEVRNPFYFPVKTIEQLPPTSDAIRGMIVYDDSIIVGRQYDIHALTIRMDLQSAFVDASLRKLNAHTGVASGRAMQNAHNFLFYLGSDGNAYALSGVKYDEKVLVTQPLTKNIDLKKDPIGFELVEFESAIGCFFDDKWYLQIKEKTLVYSYKHRAWTVYSGLHAHAWLNYNFKLIWSDHEGSIREFDNTTFLDVGAPYKSIWKSKRFYMNSPSLIKYFKEFFFVLRAFENHNSVVDVLFEVDYDSASSKVEVSSQLSVWGKSKWGDLFINRSINESMPVLVSRRGRNINITLSNGYEVVGEVDLIDDLNDFPGRIEGVVVYCLEDSGYYHYTDREWVKRDSEFFNQQMMVYQINGDYEERRKR